MKILHVYKDYYPPVRGGIEGHMNLVANGQRKRGHDVTVLVSNTENKLCIKTIDGIKVVKLPQLGRIASAPINVTFSFWLKRLGEDCDIIHYHLPNPTAVLAYLFSGLKKRVIVSYHSDIVRQKYLKLVYNPFQLMFLRKVHTILAASMNYINSSKILQRFYKKCRLIPYGIDLDKYQADEAIIKKSDEIKKIYGNRLILFVGRFRHYKGLHVLIDAMNNVNAKLLLIGSGYLENELRKQTIKNNLNDKVVFLGDADDMELKAFLNACDIFVLPSIYRSEAFGIVQLEAMAFSKPLVCTELGTGTSFINKNGETGYVVEPGNANDLSNALNKLLDNKNMRKQFGEAAHKRLLNIFTSEKMMEGIMDVYLNDNVN